MSSAEGVLYSCTGDAYVAEGLRSARSSLRHNPLPHLLLASADAGNLTHGEEGLTISRFEPSGNPYRDKIASMRRSPFERTIYLDSDTFVLDEIAHVLRLLDRYDMAVAYASYHALEDPEVPRAFYEFNTGVLAWRASERTAAFMKSWEETYLAWLREEPFRGARLASRGGRADQPAFRRCAWQHGLRVFVLAPEYNFRINCPVTLVEEVRVIHGRHPDYGALARSVNYTQGRRTWPRRPLYARILRRVRG